MRFLLTILFVNFFLYSSYAQSAAEQIERYGSVEAILEHRSDLRLISSISGVDIDHGSTIDNIHLVCTPAAYQKIIDAGIEILVKERKSADVRMKSADELRGLLKSKDCIQALDYYPSYEAYEEMMEMFASNYPDLCQLINAGTLPSGRKILILKISNGDDEPTDPNFFYTSTMHGDEVVGYIMMLNYIDHLLCQYGSNERITHLVNNINIYINPLANPDGTYRGGNSTIESATRFNANFVNLNRNFPDPKGGQVPQGGTTQAETQIFLDFAEDVNVHLSCNLHGGVELINYPWDTYQERHADDNWFIDICRDYADTVQHYSPPGYFTDIDNGITNGYDWYEVEGGRQDYHVYFKRGRETTLELSDDKIVDAEDLPLYWEYNRNALLNYMEEALIGLKGFVTDCDSGLPIEAEVFIEGHDKQNSSVFSDAETGVYFRYLAEGTYYISYTSPGYDTVSYFTNIIDRSTIEQNVEICPTDMVSTDDIGQDAVKIVVKPGLIHLEGLTFRSPTQYSIHAINGQKIQTGTVVDRSINLNSLQSGGIYILRLENSTHSSSRLFSYFE